MNKITLFPLLLTVLATTAYSDNPKPSATEADTTNTQLTSPTPATSNVPTAPAATPTIDCNYHIPASQTAIDSATITTWGEKAALQSFSFTGADIQNQLTNLKPCYTEQGWKSFNEALQKSGNLDSIKSQGLNVSAQKEGEITTNSIKDNQWKVTLPIQVVYQNEKEKITQRLNVSILIGRKPTGELGIMQMIATTRPAAAPTKPADSAATTPATPGTPPTDKQPAPNSINTTPPVQ
jgi:hypothetical protein